MKSKKTTWRLAQKLISGKFNIYTEWNNEWKNNNPDKLNLIDNPAEGVPGSDLSGREWVTFPLLNRLRTDHGRTGFKLHKRGLGLLPWCDCGHEKQTVTQITDKWSIWRIKRYVLKPQQTQCNGWIPWTYKFNRRPKQIIHPL